MARTSPQPHERDNFVEAVTTMTVPLEVDGEGRFGTGGPNSAGSGGETTVQPQSLCVHRDGTTTAFQTATRSRRHHVNLMSLLGAILSNPNTGAEEKGVALKIPSVIAMHNPDLMRKYCLNHNIVVAVAIAIAERHCRFLLGTAIQERTGAGLGDNGRQRRVC